MSKKKEKIIGIYRANKKGYGFVNIDKELEEIFIPARMVNTALDGDKVEVKVAEIDSQDRINLERTHLD